MASNTQSTCGVPNSPEDRSVAPHAAWQARACRYCERPLGDPFLELGEMPLANSFTREAGRPEDELACPLSVVYCPGCQLVQLSHVVPAPRMFSRYLYVSSTTDAFRRHFRDYAEAACAWFADGSAGLAVDIGSNDGALVKSLLDRGVRAIGVEPASNLCDEANRQGLPTINRYFDRGCVDLITADAGHASIVTANNVFAHIDDAAAVCRNVHRLLRPDGLFVIECPYLITMCEQTLFDMIYHEHLSYLSATAARFVLERHDFEILDILEVPSHGGSLRITAQKRGGPRQSTGAAATYEERERVGGYVTSRPYQEFAARVERVKALLRDAVAAERASGRTVVGYGAPAKASTLINYCGWSADDIAYLVDDSPLKEGTFAPGSAIPVVGRARLDEQPPDTIFVFAWNFADEIIAKVRPRLSSDTRWIVPLPTPRVI